MDMVEEFDVVSFADSFFSTLFFFFWVFIFWIFFFYFLFVFYFSSLKRQRSVWLNLSAECSPRANEQSSKVILVQNATLSCSFHTGGRYSPTSMHTNSRLRYSSKWLERKGDIPKEPSIAQKVEKTSTWTDKWISIIIPGEIYHDCKSDVGVLAHSDQGSGGIAHGWHWPSDITQVTLHKWHCLCFSAITILKWVAIRNVGELSVIDKFCMVITVSCSLHGRWFERWFHR